MTNYQQEVDGTGLSNFFPGPWFVGVHLGF